MAVEITKCHIKAPKIVAPAENFECKHFKKKLFEKENFEILT